MGSRYSRTPTATWPILPLPRTKGRIAVSGNQLLQSIDHGGHDKVVVFKRYGTRTVLSGEPAKSTQENNYQGAIQQSSVHLVLRCQRYFVGSRITDLAFQTESE